MSTKIIQKMEDREKQTETSLDRNRPAVMIKSPAGDYTLDDMRTAAMIICSEDELAKLYATVENQLWWIDDDLYDFEPDTSEYIELRKTVDGWAELAQELRDRIINILQVEGNLALNLGWKSLLPFMKRNGFRFASGWWVIDD